MTEAETLGPAPAQTVANAPRPGSLHPDVQRYAKRSVADNTTAAYTADWRRFQGWCQHAGVDPLLAGDHDVARWLADAAAAVDPAGSAAYAPATLRRWLSGVNQVHAAARGEVPGRSELVRRTMAGIRRTRAQPPSRRRPLHLAEIDELLDAAERASIGWVDRIRLTRDRLILLGGFYGAFRSAELAALQLRDVEPEAFGATATVRMSKTDQQAAGMTKALPRTASPARCAVCAWTAWRQLVDAHDTAGRPAVIAALSTPRPAGHQCTTPPGPPVEPRRPLLRWLGRHGWPTDRGISPDAIRTVVMTRARDAGMPSDVIDRLGSHSLRAGFVTDAIAAGATDAEVMRQTGHRSITQVRAYQRDAPHIGNAVTRLT